MEDALEQVAKHCSNGVRQFPWPSAPAHFYHHFAHSCPSAHLCIAVCCTHKHAELNVYSDCVDANPSSWQVVCADRKAELTACAAKCSGLVNNLKQRCRDEILQYERCLQANAGMPDTCVPQLERLWACSERPAAGAHVCDPDCKH